jgi:RNA polymerase sigma-70 factor, ECF subfamily
MGTLDGFEAFYAAGFARVVGQVALVTGDRGEAEDVTQEAFARASLRWARVCRYDLPEAWVRRVALNLAVNRARSLRRRLLVQRRADPPAPPAAVSEEALVVGEALQALSPAHRQVLVLHYLLELSVEEIAQEVGAPTGTVKSRLARGRQALAARLGDLEEAQPHHA